MGINSGEVVVGTIGDDLRMDYTAQGQVIGIAARLQTLADPGKAYLSEHTAALVSGFFELESLGRFTVKGVSRPLAVFSLAGAGRMRTRLDLSRARGLSRFVGRADEMTALEAALARVQEGQAQLVGVVADAGTGKSRLCEEFAERCRNRAIAIRTGRGVAHGRLLAFHPLIELLQEVFGVTDRDGPREARQKIAGALVLVDRRLEDSLPLFFDFLGVPDPERAAPVAEPADVKRQLFAAIARLLRALGEREPNVILLEDLHWFDDASTGFLETLAPVIAGTRRWCSPTSVRSFARRGWSDPRISSCRCCRSAPRRSRSCSRISSGATRVSPTCASWCATVRAAIRFSSRRSCNRWSRPGSSRAARGAYRL